MIYYVVSYSLDAVGGHQAATVEKIEALERLGYRVEVISPKKGRGVRAIFSLFMVELKFFVASFLSKKNDYFITRGWIGLLALPILRFKGKKIAREVHSDLVEESKHINNGAGKWLIRMVGYYTYFLDFVAGYLIYNHPAIEEHFRKKYKGLVKGDWYYNGVAPHKMLYVGMEEGGSSRGEKPVLVFVGNVSKWHGLDQAIRCFLSSEYLKNFYDFIVIGPVGAPEDFKEFEIHDSVKFLGKMDNREVQSWISSSCACLLPVNPIRVSPGSPLKLYEYLAHGKPVITQENVAGYSDVVNMYSSGLCVDFYDTESASRRIESFIREGGWEESDIKERVQKEITWDSVMEKWISGIERNYR